MNPTGSAPSSFDEEGTGMEGVGYKLLGGIFPFFFFSPQYSPFPFPNSPSLATILLSFDAPLFIAHSLVAIGFHPNFVSYPAFHLVSSWPLVILEMRLSRHLVIECLLFLFFLLYCHAMLPFSSSSSLSRDISRGAVVGPLQLRRLPMRMVENIGASKQL